jgi:hypothetical protein
MRTIHFASELFNVLNIPESASPDDRLCKLLFDPFLKLTDKNDEVAAVRSKVSSNSLTVDTAIGSSHLNNQTWLSALHAGLIIWQNAGTPRLTSVP